MSAAKSVAALRKRREIRDTVRQRIVDGTDFSDDQVLGSRDQPLGELKKFVNIFFLGVDRDTQNHSHHGDGGKLVVRIATRNATARGNADALCVDDELDELAVPIIEALEVDDSLGSLVDQFNSSRHEYGEPQGSAFTYLALMYDVEYETKD